MSDLTAQEGVNVRSALEYLRVRCGSWALLAKALRAKLSTVKRIAGEHDPATASIAIRAARLAGASVDDLLAGKWPAPGTCPHCGQRKPSAAAQ